MTNETHINDLMPDELEHLPEAGFKFVYAQAVDPGFAENLVNELREIRR